MTHIYDPTAPFGVPRRKRAAWADHSSGGHWPLQHHDTPHLIDMHQNLMDAHNAGESDVPDSDSWLNRAQNYAGELLDRHEAGDALATRWADQKQYTKPDYMSDAAWAENRELFPEDYPVDPRGHSN